MELIDFPMPRWKETKIMAWCMGVNVGVIKGEIFFLNKAMLEFMIRVMGGMVSMKGEMVRKNLMQPNLLQKERQMGGVLMGIVRWQWSVQRGSKKRKGIAENEGQAGLSPSPMSRADSHSTYMGPILADVEKTMQAERGTKEVSVKRKFRDEEDIPERSLSPPKQGKWK